MRRGGTSRRTSQGLARNKIRFECNQFAPSLSALYLGTRAKRIRESEMTPPAEMSGQHETARQQSRAAWGAVASGWHAQREELWKASRPVGERMKAPSRYFPSYANSRVLRDLLQGLFGLLGFEAGFSQ